MEWLIVTIAFLLTIGVFVIWVMVAARRNGKRNEVVDPEAQKEIKELDRIWRAS